MKATIFLLLAVLFLGACADTATPPPMVAPAGEDRYLPDPRTGFTGSLQPAVSSRLESAYRYALAGDEAQAMRLLAELRQRSPDLVPATLLEAMMAIRGGRLDDARRLIEWVREREPENLAAREPRHRRPAGNTDDEHDDQNARSQHGDQRKNQEKRGK